MTAQSSKVLQQFGKAIDPDIRLFCFPYAGSGAHLFSEWTRRLPREIEVIGVNYWTKNFPNDLDFLKLARPSTLAEMAADITAAMVPLLDTPFALLGHSMGGLVAYEVQSQIKELAKVKPRALFISAARAPHNIPADPLHLMDEEKFRQKLMDLNGIPQEIIDSPELYSKALHRLRIDFATCETYRKLRYEPIAVPLTVFHGKNDKSLTLKDSDDWREHAGNGYSLKVIDGDHFFIHRQQEALLSLVKETIL